MKQLTAKSVEDVLRWMESTPHHKGAVVGIDYSTNPPTRLPEARFILSGYHARLIIPFDIHEMAAPLYSPGGYFDTRMYRPNTKGRAFLRRLDRLASRAAGQQPRSTEP